MQNQEIGRTTRHIGCKALMGMLVLMLSLLAGLMTQSQQARAEMENFPIVIGTPTPTPTPTPGINSPDTNPVPEDPWTPTPTPESGQTRKPYKVVRRTAPYPGTHNGATSPYNGTYVYFEGTIQRVWGIFMVYPLKVIDNNSNSYGLCSGVGEVFQNFKGSSAFPSPAAQGHWNQGDTLQGADFEDNIKFMIAANHGQNYFYQSFDQLWRVTWPGSASATSLNTHQISATQSSVSRTGDG